MIITGIDTLIFLAIQLGGIRKLEAFIAAIVGVISLCFVVEMFLAHESGKDIVRALSLPGRGANCN